MTTLRTTALGALALLLAIGLALPAQAQEVVPAPDARPSPLSMAQLTTDAGYVKIVYGAPQKRDRVIFGELVPYGEVWRTGANEATELTTTSDLLIAGETLPAGTYSVFTIPTENEWTVIFNRGLGQWGSYNYDESMDVLRVTVPASQGEDVYEAFTINFDEADGGATNLAMRWDQTMVAVPVEIVGSM